MLAGQDGKAEFVLPVTNVDHSPYRFRMHPAEQVRSLMAIEAMGLELLAIYHSHPEGPAGPSAVDVREAAYPEAAYLVARPGARGWTARAFRIAEDRVEEIPWALEA